MVGVEVGIFRERFFESFFFSKSRADKWSETALTRCEQNEIFQTEVMVPIYVLHCFHKWRLRW